MDRRSFLSASAVLPLASTLPARVWAQDRSFAPRPGQWRTFEIVTRLEIADAGGGTQAWVPVPAVDAGWQQSLDSTWTGNAAESALRTDPVYGARMVQARFAADEKSPVIEVTSRVRTQSRSLDWATRRAASADAATLALYTRATDLMPTDGIVRETAQKATAGKTTDVDHVRALYDWVVANTYREPKVEGCGVGDIKAMLETGNMGGKCGDINALFVGLCRASGIPARDVYGIRVAKSAFGYRELGAGGPDISKAQHCRAEVWLRRLRLGGDGPGRRRQGAAAGDAGVAEGPRAPGRRPGEQGAVRRLGRQLDGVQRGARRRAAGIAGPRVAFLMYPQAETRGERVDSLDPETFKYRITAREITA